MNLETSQVDDLARSLADAVQRYFQDPENEQAFREWMVKKG